MGYGASAAAIGHGLVIGSTYAVVAIAFALAFTVLRVINFAHPDIFMVGMFAGLLPATQWPALGFGHRARRGRDRCVPRRLRPRADGDAPLRRPRRPDDADRHAGRRHRLQNGMALIAGPDPVAYPALLPRLFIDIGPVALTLRQIVNFGICLGLLALVSLYVRRTSYGRATRAIAERPDVAAAFGVNVSRICQFTILLASAMAGVAAVSVGMLYGSASASSACFYGLKAFICMLVAGKTATSRA